MQGCETTKDFTVIWKVWLWVNYRNEAVLTHFLFDVASKISKVIWAILYGAFDVLLNLLGFLSYLILQYLFLSLYFPTSLLYNF